MLAGSELLIILAIVAILIALISLVLRTQERPAAVGAARTIEVPAAAHPWLIAVVADLHGLPKHSVEWLSRDVVVITWTRRSGWVFVVGIFLFPLGLAALFYTMTEHGTIAVVAEGPPAGLALGGQFSNAAVERINAHIPD